MRFLLSFTKVLKISRLFRQHQDQGRSRLFLQDQDIHFKTKTKTKSLETTSLFRYPERIADIQIRYRRLYLPSNGHRICRNASTKTQ